MQVSSHLYTTVKREEQNPRLPDWQIWCYFVLWCVWLLQKYRIHCRLSHCAFLLVQLSAVLLVQFTLCGFFSLWNLESPLEGQWGGLLVWSATQIHTPKRVCNSKITQRVIFTQRVHTVKHMGIMRVFDRVTGKNLCCCQRLCFLWNNQLKEELKGERWRRKIKLIWCIYRFRERET